MINQQGVTLVELLIVMIISSIIIVPISNGFLTSTKANLINLEVHQANNLARSCAEHLTHNRKKAVSPYAAHADINATDCDIAIPNFATNGVIDPQALIANTTAPCPGTATECAEVIVTANNNGGDKRAEIRLFFVF